MHAAVVKRVMTVRVQLVIIYYIIALYEILTETLSVLQQSTVYSPRTDFHIQKKPLLMVFWDHEVRLI